MCANSKDSDREILIDGKLYNVSSFKHPGGSIIKFFYRDNAINCTYPDATTTWHAFHSRSKRARILLKSLPSRIYEGSPSSSSDSKSSGTIKDQMIEDFHQFESELRQEGFFDPSISHVTLRILEIFMLFYIGYHLILANWWIFGALICGIAQGKCGWLEHEGGHISLTGVIKIDIMIQTIVYGFGDGMSAGYWRNQHNKHHATPQRLQHDVDLNTLPLVAFNAEIARLVGPLGRWWIKIQAFIFPTITPLLVTLGWQLYLHPRYSIRTKRYSELFFMIFRLVVLRFVLGDFSLKSVVYIYLLSTWFGANYIFLHFSLSHTHKPISQPNIHHNWVRYAADYTTNIDSSWWCNWLMGYLNFQIEHHLFPSMPQFRFPEITDRVRELFRKHELDYDCCSYLTAFRRTLGNLQDVADTITEVQIENTPKMRS
uniref:Delta-5 desaturase n=1 Tax=Hirondellea gigas TaxID=1518452 RepID=A0A6A7G9V0_9CRUS